MEYIIPVIVVVTVSALCYYYLTNSQTVEVITNDGKKELTKGGVLPSVNQKGLEFSYTGWLFIDDFTYRFGAQKVIFVKGSPDLSVACPALVIDANTNVLLVKLDTFGAQETISIVSVPSKKWLHFAIVVKQEAVDVYINGITYAHHTLTQLPKQNTGALSLSPNGGFAGKVSTVIYTPRALAESEVLSLAAKPPSTKEVVPPYFDASWFKA